MTSYLEIIHFIKTFLQGSVGLFHKQRTTKFQNFNSLLRGENRKIKINKKRIFIWMKASDKEEKIFLFLYDRRRESFGCSDNMAD